METPYTSKSDKSFWKTAVESVCLEKELFSLIHEIKIEKENPRISSVGSCFAQHVGEWLIKNGFIFNQSTIERNSISSFALGNIYTPRSLLQWLDIIEIQNPSYIQYDVYLFNNRYFDLLRPNFNSNGFDSRSDLQEARISATCEIISTIKNTDLFIFTLGLTEAWKDKNGVFYPVCPGVVCGEFDSSVYSFYNFTYDEIKSDLESLSIRFKKINPDIKIVLTVSPVPLTATATENHVLVASQYSKSTLRSVAGFLAENSSDFEYFPSYEIITSPLKGDFRFEDNLRTVTPKAVGYVMEHFKSVFVDNLEAKDINKSIEINDDSFNEIVCEDELLEAFNKLDNETKSNNFVALTLVGDSHMGKLSRAFNEIDVRHCGGIIMNGSGFSGHKYALCDIEYFVPLECPESRALWLNTYRNLSSLELNIEKSIIIANIGVQLHIHAGKFVLWYFEKYQKFNELEVENSDFNDFFSENLTDQFRILKGFSSNGHQVIVISDPPFSKYFSESKELSQVINRYHVALGCALQEEGIEFYNAADVFENEISNGESFVSLKVTEGRSDWFHGNDQYYIWLAKKLNLMFIDGIAKSV